MDVTNKRGPRVAEEVSIEQLEEVGRQLIAQGTRMIANLDCVRRATSLAVLDVKNLPSLDQAFDKLASFLGAVEKAASRATLSNPVRREINSAWAAQAARKRR